MAAARTTELHLCDSSGELLPAAGWQSCGAGSIRAACDACRSAKAAYDRDRRRRLGGRRGMRAAGLAP